MHTKVVDAYYFSRNETLPRYTAEFVLHRHIDTASSERLGARCSGDVGGRVGKSFPGREGGLLIMIAGFADHVAPAVVPGNSCLIAVHRPCAMGRSLALGRLTVAIQRYVEGHTANAGTRSEERRVG